MLHLFVIVFLRVKHIFHIKGGKYPFNLFRCPEYLNVEEKLLLPPII